MQRVEFSIVIDLVPRFEGLNEELEAQVVELFGKSFDKFVEDVKEIYQPLSDDTIELYAILQKHQKPVVTNTGQFVSDILRIKLEEIKVSTGNFSEVYFVPDNLKGIINQCLIIS